MGAMVKIYGARKANPNRGLKRYAILGRKEMVNKQYSRSNEYKSRSQIYGPL